MLTRDDVIQMANDAGITFVTEFGVASATHEWLERFAAAAYAAGAAAEREACAQVCDHIADQHERQNYDKRAAAAADQCAIAIRQRAAAGCQAQCRCGPDGCADSACPGRVE